MRLKTKITHKIINAIAVYKAIVALLALLLAVSVYGADGIGKTDFSQLNWQFSKEQNGIKVYKSKVDGSRYLAGKAVATIKADINDILTLIANPANCVKWVYRCKHSKLQQIETATKAQVYLLSNFPFPINDREVLLNVVFEKDKASGIVTMVASAEKNISEENVIDPVASTVRILQFDSQWRFTPIEGEESMVLVENSNHFDPNGNIPAWVMNRFVLHGPYKTLRNMQTIIDSRDFESFPAIFD